MAAPQHLSYEVSVSGKLGPVLRAMAERSAAVSSEILGVTVVRMRARDREDLVDVAARLSVRGFELIDIRAMPGADDAAGA